jgi:hypothetical protein
VTRSREKGSVLALAFLVLLAAGSPLRAQIDVTVELLGPPPADGTVEITILAEPAEVTLGRPAEAEREFPVAPGSWRLDLPVNRAWRLRAEAPGYWGPGIEAVPPTTGEVILQLFPTGILRGELAVTAAEAIPPAIELGFEGDAYGRSGAEIPPGTVLCPVSQGMFRCEVPAGTLNLTLAGDHWVPQRRWEFRVGRDVLHDLGLIELELGGTVWGWLELEGAGAPSEECEVRLIQRRSAPGGAGGTVGPSAAINPDGSFEFNGVPGGEVVLTASQPDYLPATSPPIEVLRGQTVQMPQPLVLRLPATLELFFTPATGPGGRGWRFRVARLDPDSAKPTKTISGEAGEDGIWVEDGLEPGRYQITLTEKLGAKGFSEEIELPGGRTTVPIDLPILTVEGQVLLADEPLAARVHFSRPEDKLAASFQSDETGFFRGLLPQEGTWQVRVDAPDERIRRSLDSIEVWAQGSSGVAVVDIILPGTVLEGEVTDLFGNAVAQASVRIQRRGAQVRVGSGSYRTDEQGRFRIRGVEPGSVSVMASSGRLRSQWFHLVLYEGQAVRDLQLVVK